MTGPQNVLARRDDHPSQLRPDCAHCGSRNRALPTILFDRDDPRQRERPDPRARLWECGDCGRYWHRLRALTAEGAT